jgi:hypothetical protein
VTADPGDAVPTPSTPQPSRGPRWAAWLLGVSVVVIAAGCVLILFLLGTRVSEGLYQLPATPAPIVTVTATPTPTPDAAAEATTPAAPGEHPWTDLAGGECVDPFTSPWADTFTVVDCAAPHAAQLVGKPVLSTDPAAPYPGEAAISGGLNLACTAPEVLDLDAAAGISDLVWQASYPVSDEQWAQGHRTASCFVSRSSGEPLTGSVAAAR